MSKLVNHAERELELLGEDPWISKGVLRIVKEFADMGHSGSSAAHTVGLIHELLQFHNLTALTDDTSEWMLVATGVWQNTRRSEAFSHDEGKHYYLLSEGGSDQNPEPLHESVKKGI